MTTLLLILQIFIVVCLIGIILIQKTGSDSLSGLSGSGNSLISSRTSSNIFTKITIILTIAFMINSLVIAKIYVVHSKSKISILNSQSETEDKSEKNKHGNTIEAPQAVD